MNVFPADDRRRSDVPALQCHGAIGYTFEHDLHLWLKRVWSLQRAWGDTAHHRYQVTTALLP